MRIAALLMLCCLLLITACSNQPERDTRSNAIGNPTAEKVLGSEANADIFLWDDIVYYNAEQIEWVQSQQIASNVEVGEIKKQFQGKEEFENGMATKLPIGTKIYSPDKKQRAVLIAVTKDKEIRYLGMFEG